MTERGLVVSCEKLIPEEPWESWELWEPWLGGRLTVGYPSKVSLFSGTLFTLEHADPIIGACSHVAEGIAYEHH